MYDATGEGRFRLRFGMYPFRSSSSKFGVEVAFLVALASLGTACEPGELGDPQEQYLRQQLDQHYSGTQGPVGTTSSGAASSEPSGPITSEPAASDPSTSDPETSSETQGATSEPTAGTVPTCALEVFHTACSGGVCHYQGAINLPPNFETDDLYTMLTTTKSGVCTSAPSYLDLENPQNSLLLLKVKGTQPGSCGSLMPPPPATLTAAQLSCLEDWIGTL